MKILFSWLLVCSFVYGAPSRLNYQELYATLDDLQTISPHFTWDRPIFLVAGGKNEGSTTVTEAIIKKKLPKYNTFTPTMITLKHGKKEYYTVQFGGTSEESQYNHYQKAFDHLSELMKTHKDAQTPLRLGIDGVEHSYLRLVNFKGVEIIDDTSHRHFEEYKSKYLSHRVIGVSSCDSDTATSMGFQLWDDDRSKNILVITKTDLKSCSEERKDKINVLCESYDNVFILPNPNTIGKKKDKYAEAGTSERSFAESYEFAGECKDKNRFGLASLIARLEEISGGTFNETQISNLKSKLALERSFAEKQRTHAEEINKIPVVQIRDHLRDVSALLQFSLGINPAVKLNSAKESFDYARLHHLSSASEFLFKAFKSYIYYTVPAARFLYIPPDMNVDAIVGNNNTAFAITTEETNNFNLIPREFMDGKDELEIYPAYQSSTSLTKITVATPENPLRAQMLQMANQVKNIAKNQDIFLNGYTLTVQHAETVEEWKTIAEKYVESLVVMATRVFQENIESYANARYEVKDQSGTEVKLGSEWVLIFSDVLQEKKRELYKTFDTYLAIIRSSFTMTDKAYLKKLTTGYEMYFLNMYFPQLYQARVQKELAQMAKERKGKANSGNEPGLEKDIVIPSVSFYETYEGAQRMKIIGEKGSMISSSVGQSIPAANSLFDKTRTLIAKKYDEFMRVQKERDDEYTAARNKLFDDIQGSFPAFTQEKFVHYLAEQSAYFNIRAHDFIDTVNVYFYSDLLQPAVEETRAIMEQKLKVLFPTEEMETSVTPEMQNTLDRYNKMIELTQKAMQLMPNM